MKDLIKTSAFFLVVCSVFFYIGYLTARTEIITKILEDKKECYSFEDLSKILISEP